jgi:hypothetical protein
MMKRLTLHRLASSLHCCQHSLYKFMQKSPLIRAKLCEGKDDNVFQFAMETTETINFFGNCRWYSSLHYFYALIFFLFKRYGNGGKFGK